MRERLFGEMDDKLDGTHGAEARSMIWEDDRDKSTRDVRDHHPSLIVLYHAFS